MINYGPIKSNDTGVFACLMTMWAAWRKKCLESSRETSKPVSRPQPGTAAGANIMWAKILKHTPDQVGAGSLFGAIYSNPFFLSIEEFRSRLGLTLIPH